jgi:hypothetical protein
VLFLVCVGGVPMTARLAGHSALIVVAVLFSELVGLLLVGFGLLALAYDGYAESVGATPAAPVPPAVPALALGLAVMAGGWTLARSRP